MTYRNKIVAFVKVDLNISIMVYTFKMNVKLLDQNVFKLETFYFFFVLLKAFSIKVPFKHR